MMNNQDDKDFQSARNHARTFGGGVYTGGVLAATALFISFVLTAFPSDAYLTRVIMTIAGLMVGCSGLAFPYALHNWAVEKTHRLVTTILYYGEMVFIGVNTIVSFVTLLAKVTGYEAPNWTILYEPFSILSIIYVIFAWGTVFNMDPHSRMEQKKREYEQTRRGIIEDTKLEYLQSMEGRRDIAREAQEEIMRLDAQRRNNSFFGNQDLVIDPNKGFVKKEQAVTYTRPAPQTGRSMNCLECGRPSGTDLYCSDACEIASNERSMEISRNRVKALQDKASQPSAPFRPE